MAVAPPASDQNARLVPSGPTNRKSRSSGNVCDSPVRVMLSVLTRAHSPKVVKSNHRETVVASVIVRAPPGSLNVRTPRDMANLR
jgi:hypothetical protein